MCGARNDFIQRNWLEAFQRGSCQDEVEITSGVERHTQKAVTSRGRDVPGLHVSDSRNGFHRATVGDTHAEYWHGPGGAQAIFRQSTRTPARRS